MSDVATEVEKSYEIVHLVLQVYRRIEVGDFWVDGLADHLAFAGVKERTQFWDVSGTIETGELEDRKPRTAAGGP